jgi:hypothetical protein
LLVHLAAAAVWEMATAQLLRSAQKAEVSTFEKVFPPECVLGKSG